MENSKLKVFTKILAIVIICLVSFIGIYVQDMNQMKNIVKGYKLGEDLKGYREIILKVDSNISDEIKTEENYEKVKKIIENRIMAFNDFENIEVKHYNIALNKQDGTISLQLPENDNTDIIVQSIAKSGTFQIKDSESGEVLLDNSKIKNVRSAYSTTVYGVYTILNIEFNSEGREELKNITTEYATIDKKSENQTDLNELSEEEKENEEIDEVEPIENSEEEKQKMIIYSLSGNDSEPMSFSEKIENGVISLYLGIPTNDTAEINSNLISAGVTAVTINNGPLPLEYNIVENQYVETDISIKTIQNTIIAICIVFGISLIWMIIKYKGKGVIATIGFLGFAAIYLLLLRYTDSIISIEAIIGITISLAIQYYFVYKLLPVSKSEYNGKYLKLLTNLIPAVILTCIFTFAKWIELETMGVALIWGLALIAIYNITINKKMIN